MITKRQIPEAERLDFLPRKVRNAYLQFETSVYNLMGQLCADYSGGYWQFYELSNGGFYMALEDDKTMHVDFPANYFEDDMSPETLSIAACLFSLNALCWQTKSEQITDNFYALRDFAIQHKEAGKILKLID